EATDLGALVHDTVESFRAQAESAGVALGADIADKMPNVEVDPARVRQVIGNLLSNAIRHTPSGGSIKVEVGSSGDHVTITVSDTGEGIPAELLPHVFDRFVKAPAPTGSGLALAMARDIVTAHHGTLRIQSEVGKGTTAVVDLPVGARS